MLLNTLILTTILTTLVASTSTTSNNNAHIKAKTLVVKAKAVGGKAVSKAKILAVNNSGKSKASVGKKLAVGSATKGKTAAVRKTVPKVKCTDGSSCKPGQQVLNGMCSPCPVKTYSTDDSGICTRSSDFYCATVDPVVGTVLACIPSYGLVNNICQPKFFARYLGYNLNGNDIKVTKSSISEQLCRDTCLGNVDYSTGFQGLNYWRGTCYCKTQAQAGTAKFVPTIDGVVSLVGSCDWYKNSLPGLSCEDVTYQGQVCLETSGSACTIPTTVGCSDPNAQLCNSTNLALTITCLSGFKLMNGACMAC